MLHHQQIAQMDNQISHQATQIFSRFRLPVNHLQRRRRCSTHHRLTQPSHRLLTRKSKDIQDILLADFIPTKRHQLVEHRLRIP